MLFVSILALLNMAGWLRMHYRAPANLGADSFTSAFLALGWLLLLCLACAAVKLWVGITGWKLYPQEFLERNRKLPCRRKQEMGRTSETHLDGFSLPGWGCSESLPGQFWIVAATNSFCLLVQWGCVTNTAVGAVFELRRVCAIWILNYALENWYIVRRKEHWRKSLTMDDVTKIQKQGSTPGRLSALLVPSFGWFQDSRHRALSRPVWVHNRIIFFLR